MVLGLFRPVITRRPRRRIQVRPHPGPPQGREMAYARDGLLLWPLPAGCCSPPEAAFATPTPPRLKVGIPRRFEDCHASNPVLHTPFKSRFLTGRGEMAYTRDGFLLSLSPFIPPFPPESVFQESPPSPSRSSPSSGRAPRPVRSGPSANQGPRGAHAPKACRSGSPPKPRH